MTNKSPTLSLDAKLDLALEGKGAPPKASYEASLAKAAEGLNWLREQKRAQTLELLGIPTRTAIGGEVRGHAGARGHISYRIDAAAADEAIRASTTIE